MSKDLNKSIENIDNHIENLGCNQLRELLKIKEQQLNSLNNEIIIFNKFISDLNQERVPLSKKYEKSLSNLRLYEGIHERNSDTLLRCLKKGSSQNGECIKEDNKEIESMNQVASAKEKLDKIQNELQDNLEDTKRYSDLRTKAQQDKIILISDISRIKKRMDERNCSDT